MSAENRLEVVRGPERESNDPSLFLNRELSVIAFNHRVLQLAQDASLPLLERLRYLAIFSSNLDEFFEVRVAGLRERASENPRARRQNPERERGLRARAACSLARACT